MALDRPIGQAELENQASAHHAAKDEHNLAVEKSEPSKMSLVDALREESLGSIGSKHDGGVSGPRSRGDGQGRVREDAHGKTHRNELSHRVSPEFAPASQKESAFMDLVFAAMKNIPGHGDDLNRQYSPITRSILRNLPFYSFDAADKVSPESRAKNNVIDVIKELKTFDELKGFVNELKNQKLKSDGTQLTKEDLNYLNPLSGNERAEFTRVQKYVDQTRKELLENPPQLIAGGLQRELSNLDILEQINSNQLEKTVRKREAHIVKDMLHALSVEKPGVNEFEKMAAYALTIDWNNHHGGTHYKRSELLDRVYREAEKNLSKEDMKVFEQKTTNFARAVNIHSALEYRAMHGLLWHSPDPIAIRAILAPLDGENRKQVVDGLSYLTEGKFRDDLSHRITNLNEYFAIDELLDRRGKIDAAGQVMVGLRNIGKRLGFDSDDLVTGVEWAGIKTGENGILKRAALLDADGWKKLEQQYAAERYGKLEDLPKIKGMPKAFATFFEVLHQSKGEFRTYENIKKIIDAATADRRYDMVTLALQMSTDEIREQLMNDQELNRKKDGHASSTMDNTLRVFEKFVPSDLMDVDRLAIAGKNRRQTLDEFFKDGEVSLLTKVNMYTSGRLYLNKFSYTKEHEAQILSTDTDGIKGFFASASDKQREKVQNDESYRESLRSALRNAMSNREAAILLSDLVGKETITSNLLALRPPGWITLKDSSDERYKRYLEEHLTEKDVEHWTRNIGNEKELARFREDLSSAYTELEVDRIISSMKEKFAQPGVSLAAITKAGLGNRPIELELSEAKNPADIVRAVFKVSDVARSQLSKQEFFGKVEALIKSKSAELTTTKEQAASLTEFAIGQLKKSTEANDGKSSELNLDPIDMVKLSASVNMGDPFIPLTAIQTAFDRIPDLKTKLQSDRALKAHFEQALRMAMVIGNVATLTDNVPARVDDQGLWRAALNLTNQSVNSISALTGDHASQAYKRFEHILQGEPLKIDELVEFASGWSAKRDVVLNYAKPDEVKALIEKTNDPAKLAWQEKVLGPSQHRELTQNCLEKGYCDAADQARIAALGDKKFSTNKFENFFMGVQRTVGPIFFGNLPAGPAISSYGKLERTQVQSMEESGFRRYQSFGSMDLLERSAIAEKLSAQLSYTQTEVGAMEAALAAFAKRDSVRSPRWQMATDLITGGKAGIEVENANNALLKAMLELKDPEKGIFNDLRTLADASTSPELAAKIRNDLDEFDKAMKNYARAEEGIADRTKALADLIDTASLLIGYGVTAKLAYGATYGGALFGDALFLGKLTAKMQMGLTYWLTSNALRENMDVEAAVKALVVFPFLQAKLPIVFSWGAGKLLNIPTQALGHGPVYKVMHYGLDKAIKAGIVIGTPASLYYGLPLGSGASQPKHGFIKPENVPSLQFEARKDQLQMEVFARLMDIGDQRK